MKKKSKIIIARLIAVLMVFSILPFDMLTTANVVMAEGLENGVEVNASLDDEGNAGGIENDGPVSVGGIQDNENELDGTGSADGSNVTDDKDPDNSDGTTEPGNSGDSNDSDDPNEPGNSDNGDDSNGSGTTDDEDGDKEDETTGPSSDDVNNDKEPAEPSKDESSGEQTEAKTYILDPETLSVTGDLTTETRYGTDDFFTLMCTSNKKASISNIASINTGSGADAHLAYDPLNWGDYANETLGGSTIANSARTKCIRITNGKMSFDSGKPYACVKITTKYPNAKLVVYASPKANSAPIVVQTKSGSTFTVACPGTSSSNPKVARSEITIGAAGEYYVGFSAEGGIILYMEVTDDPNAKEPEPGAGNTAGITFTYDEPVMGVKTDIVSFINKSDESAGAVEGAEEVSVENVHLKVETLDADTSTVITTDIKSKVQEECTKLMNESDNKDAGAEPIVSYYDMSLINKDAGDDEDNSELQIKEGKIKFKLPYPENVGLTNKIVVLHDDKVVIDEVERANKDSDGFWVEADSFSPYTIIIEPTEAAKEGKIELTDYNGYAEGAYVEWKPYTTTPQHSGYMVAVSKDKEKWDYIDDQLIRKYPTYFRADALGLTEGIWYMKVEAVNIGSDNKATPVAVNTVKLNVKAHDRSGYAWVNGTSSGAYNEDGSLIPTANVIYITETTKDTVQLNVTGATTNPCVGIQGILDGYKKGNETKPLDIRIIGNVTNASYLLADDIVIENKNSGNSGKGGITIEGVGEDAVANGWGIRVKSASNVEIRNLGFMNRSSKGEKDNVGLQQDNDHVWVHHCDLFYGNAGSDADQIKGDGAMDCKKSNYVTFSYNHFWDSGKCCLLGLSEGTNDLHITYHHNWFDHSDSRHPRVRFFTTHVYNNYYDGNAKYGVGGAKGKASIFVENNYFRNCKYPMLISMQGSDLWDEAKQQNEDKNGTFSSEDGSIIKAYGNIMVGQKRFIPYSATDDPNTVYDETKEFDAYVASSRDEKVPASVTAAQGGGTYNNFDTAAGFYKYTPDAAENVPEIVRRNAGRVNGGDFKWTFDNATADTSYAVDMNLKNKCLNYKSELVSVGGLNGKTVNIEYTVTFDPNNGSDSWDVTVQGGNPVAKPDTDPTSSDASKTFDGWYKGNAKWNFSNVVSGNMTLTAIYLGEDENPPGTGGGEDDDIDDDNGDDNGDDDNNNASSGDYVHNFTEKDKESTFYKIAGNTATNKGTVTYKGLTLTKCLKMESNITSISFKAPAKGTLTLVFGGSTAAAGKKVQINGANKTCDTNGIYTQNVGEGDDIVITKGEAINLFYIEYIPEGYNITVDKADGSANKTIVISKGSQLTDKLLQDPTRIGYEFTGWVDGSGNPITLPITPEGDMTLKATWNEVKYTITIDRNNGTGTTTMEVGKGDKIKASQLPNPEREGYTFAGWVDEGNNSITLPYEPTKDMRIIATWIKDGNDTPDPIPSGKDSWTVFFKQDLKTYEYEYTGSAIKPKFTVYGANGKVLVEGSDYTVRYSNNINASRKLNANGDGYEDINANRKPTITITGRGVITGQHKVTFNIKPKDISKAKGGYGVTESDEDPKLVAAKIIIEKGKKATAPVICYNGIKLTARDYDYVTPKTTVYNGNADDVLEIKGKGNYEKNLKIAVEAVDKETLRGGKVKKLKVNIKSEDVKKLTYIGDKQEAQKENIRNCIEVKPAAATSGNISEGTDYVVVLPSNITDAGNVKVTVVGLGDYSGCTVTKSVKIQPCNITGTSTSTTDSNASDKVTVTGVDAPTYTSTGATLDNLKVRWKGIELVNGRDYKLTYSGNRAVTTNGRKAKCTIAFMGNFKGRITGAEFDVTKAKLEKGDNTIKVEIPDKVCNANASCKSSPYVTVNDVLVKASEYDITYRVGETGEYIKNPKAAFGSDPDKTVVYVKIKAKDNKNYTTSDNQEVTGQYTVWKKDAKKKDLSKARVTFYDKAITNTDKKKVTKMEYTGDELKFDLTCIEVKIGRETLTADKYTVKYINNVNKGKATVIIKAAGENTIGCKTQTFSIVSKNIKDENALKRDTDPLKVKSIFNIFNW